MILIALIQLDKISAPAPDAHNQVAVVFGMLLRVQQALPIHGIQLQLMPAAPDKQLHQLGDLGNRFVLHEYAVRKLYRQRAAVDGTFEVGLGEGFDQRNRPVQADIEGRRVIGGQWHARFPSAVAPKSFAWKI